VEWSRPGRTKGVELTRVAMARPHREGDRDRRGIGIKFTFVARPAPLPRARTSHRPYYGRVWQGASWEQVRRVVRQSVQGDREGTTNRRRVSVQCEATIPPHGKDKPSPLLWTGLACRFVEHSPSQGDRKGPIPSSSPLPPLQRHGMEYSRGLYYVIQFISST